MRLINFFRLPEIQESDYYERARFKLTWNINVLMILITLLLVVLTTLTVEVFTPHYLLGAITCLSGVVYMRVKKRYRLVAKVLTVGLYVIVFSSMFFVKGFIHYIEPIWMIIITLYAYFTLNIKWGAGLTLSTAISCSSYFFLNLNTNIRLNEPHSFLEKVHMGVEVSICMLIIGYIIYQFIAVTKHAESQLKLTNNALVSEKRVVVKQNKEKTILLQEIHHRVKNNLQVVTSMLRMQQEEVHSEETKQHFNDAINRIMSMALIHQRLYQNDNLSQIDLYEYFDGMIYDLLVSYGQSQEVQRKLSVEIKQLELPKIVPLALIVTELISNSAKHAFDQTKDPMLQLEIATSENGGFRMKYADNGEWKEPSGKSFGSQLIEAFCEQLDGTVNIVSDEGGTCYEFQFEGALVD